MILSNFARYLLVGLGSNAVNFAVYIVIKNLEGSLWLASAIGYGAGCIVSYHFGRIWVFGQRFGMSRRNVTLFVIVYAIGGLGMTAIINGLTTGVGVDYRISWLFGAGFGVANNFLGQKWLVFNK